MTGWTDLVTRLDRVGTVARWAVRESALAGLGGVRDLSDLTAREADAGRADEVLGALVRVAAVDGGNDPDAVLVLLYLLEPGIQTLARRLADFDPGADTREQVVADDRTWWEPALTAAAVSAGAMAPAGQPQPIEELADLLHWAAQRRVVDVADLRMVWELERLAGYGAAATAGGV